MSKVKNRCRVIRANQKSASYFNWTLGQSAARRNGELVSVKDLVEMRADLFN